MKNLLFIPLMSIVFALFTSGCSEPRCNDGKYNGTEEYIDCGGECEPCYTCNDGIQNQGETRIDCGGPSCETCPEEWELLGKFGYSYPTTITDLFFLNEKVIFLLSYNGEILKSTDGGLTWTSVHSQVTNGILFLRIHFFDALHGVATGAKKINSDPDAITLVTSDGGNTWQRHDHHFITSARCSFTPSNWVVFHSYQLSKDGGLTFKKIEPGDFPGILLNDKNYLIKLTYFDPNNAYAIVHKRDSISPSESHWQSLLYRTQDGGQNWNNQATYDYFFGVDDIQLFSLQTFICANDNSQTYNIWTNYGQQYHETTVEGSGLYFTDDQTAYLFPKTAPADSTHYILKSSDGGHSWQPYGFFNAIDWENNNYPRQTLKFEKNGQYLYAYGEGRLLRLKLP